MRRLRIANRFDGLPHLRNNAPAIAGDSEPTPTFASAAELAAVGEARERAAAARYGSRVATMAAAGNAQVADLLRRLEAEKCGHGDEIARRAVSSCVCDLRRRRPRHGQPRRRCWTSWPTRTLLR